MKRRPRLDRLAKSLRGGSMLTGVAFYDGPDEERDAALERHAARHGYTGVGGLLVVRGRQSAEAWDAEGERLWQENGAGEAPETP